MNWIVSIELHCFWIWTLSCSNYWSYFLSPSANNTPISIVPPTTKGTNKTPTHRFTRGIMDFVLLKYLIDIFVLDFLKLFMVLSLISFPGCSRRNRNKEFFPWKIAFKEFFSFFRPTPFGYTYTKNKELMAPFKASDFPSNLVINLSYKHDQGFNTFLLDTDYDSEADYFLCPQDCRKCSFCTKSNGINIGVRKH